MSQSAPFAVQSPAPSPRADVRGAIANASAATGVDFGYLLGQARMESSLDPSARAGSSSAAGLFQFTSGTWLSMLRRHGAENGLGWASDAIASGRISDPAVRERLNGMGIAATPGSADKFAQEMQHDLARYGSVVKSAGIKLD